MTEFWNSARYVIGVLVIATFPPSLLLWVAIHPFTRFWRKLGPVWTYVLLGLPVVGYIVGTWVFRRTMLVRDLGANPFTLTLAVLALGAGALLKRATAARLNFATLSGVPELSKEKYPGTLITDGVFGRVRNPRYIEVVIWVSAYVLFANYLGPYIVLALSLPLIYVVVRLEERELRQRFGTAYEEYCRRVPRFIPKPRLRT